MNLFKKMIVAITILCCSSAFAEKTYLPPKSVRCIKLTDENAWHKIVCDGIDHMYLLENNVTGIPVNTPVNFTFLNAYSIADDEIPTIMFKYQSAEGYQLTLQGTYLEVAKSSDPHWQTIGYGRYGCENLEAQCPITNLPI